LSGHLIFIKRKGGETMRVRVFEARPRQKAAVRSMLRRGLPLRFISRCLGIRYERLDRLHGAQAVFKW
jgi:hypothetical protein